MNAVFLLYSQRHSWQGDRFRLSALKQESNRSSRVSLSLSFSPSNLTLLLRAREREREQERADLCFIEPKLQEPFPLFKQNNRST